MATMTLDQALRMAHAYHDAKRLVEAESICQQILASLPNQPDALHLLGLVAYDSGRFEKAVEWISKAIAQSPVQARYFSNLGAAWFQLGRMDKAASALERAVTLDGRLPDAHMNLGSALHGLGRFDEAIASCQRALDLNPNSAAAYHNLGNALMGKERWQDAAARFQRALELEPNYAEAQTNLGNAYWEMHRLDDAIACYRRALVLRPDYAVGLGNLGAGLSHKGMFAEAIKCYRRSIACQPDFVSGHWNLAALCFLHGQFEEGWREHEWRWRYAGVSPQRNFTAPQWNGKPAPGQTIFLHAEQGLGDAIQFMRYVPFVRERAEAGRVIVGCRPALVRLFAQSGGWDAEFVADPPPDGTALPAFDQHLPLLSLPLTLGMFEPLAMHEPYLRADPESRAAWRARLVSMSNFRVGLAWAGNPAHREDRRRSIEPGQFLPILRTPDVSFYDLQIEPAGAPPPPLVDAGLVDLREHITDFADTAALMSELDLIISVDTATVHLAGALGRPVWTLVPFVPDWRWGLGREDTPWYPTMRLFRQPTSGDWESVVQKVADALENAHR